MATPRVTIDQLPEQAIPEDANYFVIQDSGVSKKMSWATIKTQPSQPLTDHLNDTSGAHAASAISAAVAGTGVDAADVQGQLGQLTTLVNSKINQSVADGLYVNITGDAMTGALTLVSDPTGALEAATKQYVDAKVIEAGGGITMGDADNRYVNLTGDTMSGPLTVDALISTGTGLALPVGEPSAADRACRRDYVDNKFVIKTGDRMTGALEWGLTSNAHCLRLANANDSPFMEFRNTDWTTRFGYMQGSPTQTLVRAEVGDAHVQSINGAALLAGKTDMKLSLEDVAGRAINGWAGFRNPIILPMGTTASDVEGLLTGKGYQVEIGVVAGSKLRVMSGGFEKASIDKDGFITAVARRWRGSRASQSIANGDQQHTGTLTVAENVGGFTGSGATGTPLIVPVDGSYAVTVSFAATAPAGGFVAAAPANLSAVVISIGGNTYMLTLQPQTGNRVGGTITAFAAAGSSITFTIRNGTGAAVTCTQAAEVVKVA